MLSWIKFYLFIISCQTQKQGVTVALAMPENVPLGIRDKIFNELTLVILDLENLVLYIKHN